VRLEPTFCPPNLLSRFKHCPADPATPVAFRPIRSGKFTVFVRENYYVVLEHDEQVAHLFAIAVAALPLISVNACVAPQGQERPVTEPFEITLRWGDTVGTLDSASFIVLHRSIVPMAWKRMAS